MECFQKDSAFDTKGGITVREKLIRVNIVLSKEQHERFKDFAKRYHGSLSQFLRMSGENEIRDQDDNSELILRPIIERQDKTMKTLEKISQQLNKGQNNLGFGKYSNFSYRQLTAFEIERVLLKNELPLSVPEILEYVSYSQEEVIDGIEYLLDRGQLTRIKRINAPSKYKIRGDMNE